VKIPHERIKGVAMNTRVGLNLEEAKRMRLLTLPRMQRNNPPTHLVVSRTGDYLRGRLIGLDEQSLTFETRLETLKISRENLSHLIWLHADELLATENKDPVNKIEDQLENPGLPRNKGMFIQTIQRDGGRLTFRPEQLSLRGIMGVSDVLGLCHVQLANVDQILINPPALADPSQSPLASWRLSDAPDPKALKEEKEETGTVPAGTESRLVGQPAPEIRLKQLDDQPFVLSQLRGQIVVLDFWASWCGPCIQLMPKVSNVVAEFEEQQVRLIAVNVEEPKEAVRAMLDRFDYSSQVVLDVDGVAARAYSAEAIPQVVIIDRLGRIARVFVGGGAKFDEQFRTALREVAAP
jgi:thiol-disulfide isomerase/thioredoxin